MRVFITGATGLIGRRLVLDRLDRGDHVVVLSRNESAARTLFAASAHRQITVVQGDPAAPGAWQESLDGCDAVIHLAGAGIAERRWSKAFKAEIVRSRVDSTHQIVMSIERAKRRPGVLISGSATGYYGDASDREVDETAGPGDDFLASLAVQWESQALQAVKHGVRVVLLRTGVVLDEQGGALKKMSMPFRMFAGGPLGSGRMYMPWIHWRDLIGLIDHALKDQTVHGPLNAVAPQAVRNREFAKALGHVLSRPVWLPTPRFALRLAIGELANSLMMSQRVVPTKAMQSGFVFLYPQLQAALDSLLKE